jgi:DNA-binding transcriptional LysR family regulator
VDIALEEAEPPEALERLREGDVDLAFVFSHGGEAIAGARDITIRPLFDEPIYAITPRRQRWRGPRHDLRTYRDERWIAGCPRCRAHLVATCAAAGFAPAIAFATDDYVAAQSLVAAGLGVSTLPGLALLANRHPDVRIDQLPGDSRQVQVATLGGAKLAVTTQAFVEVVNAVTNHPPVWPRNHPARRS